MRERIVAYSGGKDSTAMLIRMIELNYKIDRILFANTGLEYPEMYKYIKSVQEFIGRKIEFIQPDTTFFHWFYGKWTSGRFEGKMRGFPRMITHAYCCRELKVKPQAKITSKNAIRYLGIAYDERYRKQKGEELRYPLIDWKWTEDTCIQYLKEKKILNPLYDKFNRLGCWLCPKQGKGSLRGLYEHYPLLWNHLKKMEKESPHGFHIRFKLINLEKEWKCQKKLECYI